MRIAVNTRFLLKDKIEGIGRFTFEIFKRVAADHSEHEFYFIFDRPYDESFIFSENIKPIVVFPPARHPILWYCWFEIRIPQILKKINADIFISPDGYLSLRSDVPQLLVTHDLAHLHRPMDIPFAVKKYYDYFCGKFAQKANHIVTVSEFSKQDIVKNFGVPSSKISVVYNAAGELFSPVSESRAQETRNTFTGGAPYFIYVGALHPRKNIVNLLKAFELFKQKSGTHIKLLIVGKKAWQNQEMEHVYTSMHYKNDVIFTGRLSDKTLKYVLASAESLVYVPFFEGFGLPVVEAFKCHTPVITSNVSSLPEVAGDAALLVNPDNALEIAQAMENMCNPETKSIFTSRLQTQSEHFNWDRSAHQFSLIIESMLNKS